MALMQLKISSENSFYVANIRGGGGRKFVAIVNSYQKDLVEFVVWSTLCKTPMEFPATILVTYVVCNHGNTQCTNCVDAFGIIYVLCY